MPGLTSSNAWRGKAVEAPFSAQAELGAVLFRRYGARVVAAEVLPLPQRPAADGLTVAPGEALVLTASALKPRDSVVIALAETEYDEGAVLATFDWPGSVRLTITGGERIAATVTRLGVEFGFWRCPVPLTPGPALRIAVSWRSGEILLALGAGFDGATHVFPLRWISGSDAPDVEIGGEVGFAGRLISVRAAGQPLEASLQGLASDPVELAARLDAAGDAIVTHEDDELATEGPAFLQWTPWEPMEPSIDGGGTVEAADAVATITGTGHPGAVVTVTVEEDVDEASAVIDEEGTWSVEVTTPGMGEYPVEARQVVHATVRTAGAVLAVPPCAETLAIQAHWTTLGVAASDARLALLDTLLIRPLLAADLWGDLGDYFSLAAHAPAAGRMSLTRPGTGDLTQSVAGTHTWATDLGWHGDNAASFLEGPTITTIPGYALDDAHLAVHVVAGDPDSEGLIGNTRASSGAGDLFIVPRRAGSPLGVRGRLNTTVSSDFGAVASAIGRTTLSRTGSGSIAAYRDGAPLSVQSAVSELLPNGKLTLGKITAGATNNFNGATIGAASIGAGLDAPREAALAAIERAWLTALGAIA